MLAVRMDPRLASRVDPSDLVQEALADAARLLPGYLRERPMPFYAWLRRLAWERLVELKRHHIEAKRRSVTREGRCVPYLPEDSALLLANHLLTSGTSPSRRLIRDELRERVRSALERLDPRDREVLVLRYLEQLSTAETAAVLELSENGVKSRLMRALIRFRAVIEEQSGEEWEP
jgi:RNA polymerase sigma-70 factor (ECF subfamily)